MYINFYCISIFRRNIFRLLYLRNMGAKESLKSMKPLSPTLINGLVKHFTCPF